MAEPSSEQAKIHGSVQQNEGSPTVDGDNLKRNTQDGCANKLADGETIQPKDCEPKGEAEPEPGKQEAGPTEQGSSTDNQTTSNEHDQMVCEASNDKNALEGQPATAKPSTNEMADREQSQETVTPTIGGALVAENDGQHQQVDEEEEEDDDDENPIPSGTGMVSRECSESDLVGWSQLLPKWHGKLSQRPAGLKRLVKSGIPGPLRGEVWQLLSGAHECDLIDRYPLLLMQSVQVEQIILRDVHRTYPAHASFRDSGSLLDSLFKVCKAYAVYDSEVGYCQGLSFLVAALLLHMPEEQAFCVFVRIMQHYGLRDLFRNNFDELYLKFYQLESLLEEHMPDLYKHFKIQGIETFIYASQWFLTVFTAKFPLNAVFYILDVFLLDGMDTIFRIALALLASSKQDLLALDFEGVLRFFRVQMPKRYRNQENVQQLIEASSEISLKKLKKYAKNYELVKQKERLMEDPIARLKRENAKLTQNNLRLEQENDDLARDLVASKIQLRAQLDVAEDKAETLNRALIYSQQDCQSHLSTISDMEDERARLEVEVSQLKEVCRRELFKAENEQQRCESIIADYKKICSQLSKRLDSQLDSFKHFLAMVTQEGGLFVDAGSQQRFLSSAEAFLERLQSSSADPPPPPPSDKPEEAAERDAKRNGGPGKPRSDLSATIVGNSGELRVQQLTAHIDELEVELARTKLALVEAECKCQQLTHDLNAGATIREPLGGAGSLASSTVAAGLTDFVKAAVSTRRSPRTTASAFAKINNLISERISSLSSQAAPSEGKLESPTKPPPFNQPKPPTGAVVGQPASASTTSVPPSAGPAPILAGQTNRC